MSLFNEILECLEKGEYSEILLKINASNYLNEIISDFIKNIDEINNNKIEPIIKIILNRIIYFNGDIDINQTQSLYEIVTNLGGSEQKILDEFIYLYDNQKIIRLKFLSLIYKFLSSYKKIFSELNFFLSKEKLVNDDIELINNFINKEIHTYFQAIFDLNNNKQFFKRITDCQNERTRNIHINQMIDRMLQVTKDLGIKTLIKLDVNVITVKKFLEYEYNEKVKYFRSFYIRTYSLFKIYNSKYDELKDIDIKINNLLKIDPLDYIDNLDDSTSSFLLSDEVKSSKFEDYTSFNYLNEENNFFSEDKDLSENRDTPFVFIDDKVNSSDSDDEKEDNSPDIDELDELDEIDSNTLNIFVIE